MMLAEVQRRVNMLEINIWYCYGAAINQQLRVGNVLSHSETSVISLS